MIRIGLTAGISVQSKSLDGLRSWLCAGQSTSSSASHFFIDLALCTGAEVDIVARELYSSNSFVDFARKKKKKPK